ncbi:D-amino-acid transaminase [Cohaesibacter celericrescens]|uniref:Probable branched-chain-amino-acid aminotransferase n=1 Tax=Cohaesibacter celericrescens TaxID=2067669 RepID=A0A2N5XR93_9HYPH|nr:D-amino-acid transaminase [Cohaesibacter celericrescens]PLW77033.1 D-amino acid aminotransferase [Cohaesibacter celericrescens]
MSRIVYVNGEFLPEDEAKISVFDRGFLFADAIYEVSTVLQGKLVDNAAHLARLQRSVDALNMGLPCSLEEIEAIQLEMLKRNDINEGGLYLQVTRGAADRDFAFPKDSKPSLVMFTQSRPVIDTAAAQNGISVVTTPDIRWQRRDIKTVGLLPASMAKQTALDAGANDAWLVEDGFITEGTSNNAHIVTKDGVLLTRALSNKILHGITRKAVLALAEETGITVEERSFTPDEVSNAAEAFITSASMFVTPVVTFNGEPIVDGKPGKVAKRLRELYIAFALKSLK